MLTAHDIVSATRGKIIQGDRSVTFKGVSIDTRKIKSGELFIAIRGHKFDGHKFVRQAVANGARGIIVSENIKTGSGVSVIKVADTTKALGLIAGFHRQRFTVPVIAVTGSAGKTTAKEMIADVLKSKWNVLKNYKTENNQIGVPLTLLNLKKTHQAVVLELGTSRPGDIKWLAEITRPTVAVFTNIGESHLQELRTPKGVFREKSQLLKYLSGNGRIIYNQDDFYLSNMKPLKTAQRKIGYSVRQKADVSLSGQIEIKGKKSKFKVKGVEFTLKSPASHNIQNALAAVAVGKLFAVNLQAASIKLSRFNFVTGRQQWSRQGSFWLIDDSYNSNPVSFRGAVETLDLLKVKGRKILICADMLELGKHSRKLHELMGRKILESSVNTVFTVGKEARFIAQVLEKSVNNITVSHFSSMEQLHRRLKSFCHKGDVLLVKGSRSMGLDKTVKFLQQNYN